MTSHVLRTCAIYSFKLVHCIHVHNLIQVTLDQIALQLSLHALVGKTSDVSSKKLVLMHTSQRSQYTAHSSSQYDFGNATAEAVISD